MADNPNPLRSGRFSGPGLAAALSFLACIFVASTSLAQPFGMRPLPAHEHEQADDLKRLTAGAYPIELPEYEGQVKQLLLLSSRWVIVAVYDVPQVVEEVNRLSDGQLLGAVDDWLAADAAGRPDWTAWRLPRRLHDRYLAQARKNLDEFAMDEPESFRITSEDDRRYCEAQRPARVTRTLVSLGGPRIRGAHPVDYAHYCILELPEPMRDGHRYSIEVVGRGQMSFDYDERRTVSRAIKVNQAGYLPDAGSKRAYLGAFAFEFGPVDFSDVESFEVIDNQTGQTVMTGRVELVERNPRFAPRHQDDDDSARPPMFGEDVYVMDLGPLEAEGEYFISIPGVGRSWTFRHAPDTYGEVFYTAMRGFYHQRAATAIESDYSVWTRHRSPVHDTIYESQYISLPPHLAERPDNLDRFNVRAATTDMSRKTENVVGGWYDAADYERNQHHYTPVFDMLWAYEFAPQSFVDGQLNIPESGNGVPDLLDEVAFGLEHWRRSQDDRGAVSGQIDAATHADYNDPDHPYSFSRRTRWNSLMYAAAAAQLARLLRPYDEQRAELYADSARRAWEFGRDQDNSLGRVVIKARERRGRGDSYDIHWREQDSHSWPYKVQAAIQMALLDNKPDKLRDIGELAEMAHPPFQWRFSHRDFSAWIYAGLALRVHPGIDEEVAEHWRDFYIETADELLEQMHQMPYMHSWPRQRDYRIGWGASTMTNFNRTLAIAWRLTGEGRYFDAIVDNADFMLGANPTGMSWTTGIGYVFPIDIQHAFSDPRREPDQHRTIREPIPGITIYGITSGPPMHRQGRDLVWENEDEHGQSVVFQKEANRSVPLYRRWSSHPSANTAQCEFSVHETMASTVLTAALLLEPQWRPDERLLQRAPRRADLLFGWWYLP